MYTAQLTIERIQALIKEKGLTQKEVLKQCDINENTLKRMTDNKGMSSFYIAKIADRLDCSVDYLLGRTDVPTINGNTQFNGDNHNGIQANVNTGNVTVNSPQKLEELETVLLDTFRTFKPTEKVKIVCDLVKEAEKKSPTAETADD